MNNLGINQQEASFGEKVFQFSSMWGLDFWFQPPPHHPQGLKEARRCRRDSPEVDRDPIFAWSLAVSLCGHPTWHSIVKFQPWCHLYLFFYWTSLHAKIFSRSSSQSKCQHRCNYSKQKDRKIVKGLTCQEFSKFCKKKEGELQKKVPHGLNVCVSHPPLSVEFATWETSVAEKLQVRGHWCWTVCLDHVSQRLDIQIEGGGPVRRSFPLTSCEKMRNSLRSSS